MSATTTPSQTTPRHGGLHVRGLRASVGSRVILDGLDLDVPSGEIHALMGPNGSGKSTLGHVLMGRPGYSDVSGSAVLDGVELIGLPTWQRARAGLFFGLQYPVEVPGVRVVDLLAAAMASGVTDDVTIRAAMEREADLVGLDRALLDRAVNVDLSGGERKRAEIVQLGVLGAKVAILDEVDSGLDVDALRMVSARVREAANDGLGVLAVTHYTRLLSELVPDRVHVFIGGRIVRSGGPELAAELEVSGYEQYLPASAAGASSSLDDLFA